MGFYLKKITLYFLVLPGIFVAVNFASAATVYVNSSAGNDSTGNGTVGAPYKTFNKGYVSSTAGDILNLSGTFTWTDANETGDVVTTGYTIAKNLTIQGQAADQTIIQAASSYATGDRAVFNVAAGYTVIINDLTVRYGYNRTGSNGGGINNEGILTVNRCNISYNYVWYYPSWGGYGGGIRNAGTLTVNDSTINNNFAQSQGGGIVNAYTASGSNVAYITNTTIAFNSTADVVATVGGAGIFIRSGTVYVTNCTIAYNVAPDGTGDTSGIDVEDPSANLYIKNSIVAGNKVTVGGTDHDVNYASGNFFDLTAYGVIHDNGGNVFGKVNSAYNGVSLAATTWYDLYGNGAGDNVFTLYGTATAGSLYLDAALAANGTMYGNQTLAITTAGSVAIDRGLATANGSVSIPTNDQRGASRNGNTDVGAYEYDGGLTVSTPTIQASNVAFSSVQYNQMAINWTNGDGAKRIVFVKAASTGTTTPADSASYTANAVFGSGTQIGSTGWYAVYSGTGSNVTITGLSPSTTYIAQVFEYNGTSGYEMYLRDEAADNPKAQATAAFLAPTTPASSLSYTSVSDAGFTVGWSNGGGEKRAVFIKAAATGTATPVNATTYVASTTFSGGTQIGSSGWYCVYNGAGASVTVTGLSQSTTYIVQVFEYNGSAGTELYLTATSTDNPKTQTTAAAPSEVTLGTGILTTGVSEASPINIWYRSNHGQSVYTAAELNAAGITGSTQITKIGFYVASAPIRALPNFIIRMKHTADTTVANWQSVTGMATVYSVASYAPVAGGFDSLTLSTPFTWNGTDNLAIDTAFNIVDYDQSGVVRYYSSANGYRYARSDGADQTNIFSGGSTSASKPQIKLTFSRVPATYTLTYAAGAHGSLTGSTTQSVTSGGSGSAVTAVPDSGYSFIDWSDDSTANPRTDSNVTTSTSVTANFADLTAPVISEVTATTTDNTAAVTWTTDTIANSRLIYGPASASGNQLDDGGLAASHSIALSGLNSCTIYYYQAASADASGNWATSTTATFTTAGCLGSSSIATSTIVTVATSTGATVTLTDGPSIVVPIGYATTSANFQIKQLVQSLVEAVAAAPSGYADAGDHIYNFTAITDALALITSFDADLTMTMSYLDSDIAGLAESTLKIFYWDGLTWSALSNCVVDEAGNSVTCDTNHFSTFGLFGQAAVTNSTNPAVATATGITFIPPAPPQILVAPKIINGKLISILSDAYQIAIADNTAFANSSWEPYLGDYDLSKFSSSTVYVKFRSQQGGESEIYVLNPEKSNLKQKSAVVSQGVVYKFKRDLKLGNRHTDVKELQKFLNANGFVIAAKGAGSPGQETTYFGTATKNALIKFQKAKKIKPANGLFGPITRKLINQ
jgi:hypothetical protein